MISRMDMEQVLWNLGVRDDTLTTDEKVFLDEQGYLSLADMMTQEQVGAFVARLEELVSMEGAGADKEVDREDGSIQLSNLINKGPMFDICYTHPRLLAAIRQVLTSDFKVHSLNSRFALPGQGNQALHMDWGASDSDALQKLTHTDWDSRRRRVWMIPGSHIRMRFW